MCRLHIAAVITDEKLYLSFEPSAHPVLGFLIKVTSNNNVNQIRINLCE